MTDPESWPPRLLRGNVALVTGAAGTLGRAIAARLCAAGARVAMTDVETTGLAMAGDEIQTLCRSRPYLRYADLHDAGSIQALFVEVERELGPVQILVNSAAIRGGVPFLDYSLEALDSMLAVNLRAVLICSQIAARRMVSAGISGSIVHLGSVGSVRAHPDAVVYDACKGALDAAARAMAVDLSAHGIRVNVVAPARPEDGDRPLMDLDASGLALGQDGVLRRDVADAVTFLVSPFAERITGQTLFVDNGLTATLRWSAPGSAPR